MDNQFLELLTKINSMNELRYYFDGNKKLDNSNFVSETYVKGVFQSLFQNTTIPATRTATIQDEIFNAIWNNNIGANGGLRGSLFPNTQNLPLPQWETQSRQLFTTMINTMDNKLFGFINIR